MKTVSVVVPCRNDGQYLDEAIFSVKAQTYPEIELIIVDDGSDDPKTMDVFQRLEQEGQKVLHIAWQGLAAARNAGIAEARGEYILPLDADDLIESTYVEKAVNTFEENTALGIVYCLADKFGTENGLWELPEFSMPQFLMYNCIFATAMFRRSNWLKCGGYQQNLIYGLEDWSFWLSLIESGYEVYRIPEILFHYRKKPKSMLSSLTQNSQQYAQATIDVMTYHADFYQKYWKECCSLWISKTCALQEILDHATASNQQSALNHKQEIAAKEQVIAAKEQVITAAKQEILSKEQELSTTRQEIAVAKQELSSANQELSSARQELSAVRQELSAARQELSTTEQKLSTTNQELSLLLQSFCWRITGPIRRIGDFKKSLLRQCKHQHINSKCKQGKC